MKTTASRIWLVIVILAITTLSCNFLTGQGDEEDIAPQPLAEDKVQSNKLGDEYRSVEGGYAFDVIPGYELEEFFGLVSMQLPDADPDVGPSFMLIGGINDESKSSSQLLDDFVSGLGQEGETHNQHEVTVDGIPGIVVDFEGRPGGKEAMGRAAFVAVTPTQMFSLVVVAPPGLWDDELESTFEAVLATITFFEPQVDITELDEPEPVEVTEPPVQEVVRQWASSATASGKYL